VSQDLAAALQRVLGYQFNDGALLERALTHRSSPTAAPAVPITSGWSFSAMPCSIS